MTHLHSALWADIDDPVGFSVYMASNGMPVTLDEWDIRQAMARERAAKSRYVYEAPSSRPSSWLAVACSLFVIVATLAGLAYGIIRSIRW